MAILDVTCCSPYHIWRWGTSANMKARRRSPETRRNSFDPIPGVWSNAEQNAMGTVEAILQAIPFQEGP
jgi:hypothetical protein